MRYNPALDGLRAIAALVVVATHSNLMLGGGAAVVVFFVLSGYLIGTILSREIAETGTVNFTRFLANRAMRLWPPLLAMLVAWLVMDALLWKTGGTSALIAALYLSDYGTAFDALHWTLGHTWSLSVEEHFYMLLPAVLLAVRCNPTAVAAIALAGFAWRAIDWAIWQDIYWTIFRFDTCIAAPMGGVLLALRPVTTRRPLFVAAVSVAALVTAVLLPPGGWKITLGYALNIAGGLGVVLALTSDNPLSRALSTPVLVYLGKISYSIYLWHLIFTGPVVASPLEEFAIVLPLTLLVSAAMYRYIETPMRVLRHGLWSTQASLER